MDDGRDDPDDGRHGEGGEGGEDSGAGSDGEAAEPESDGSGGGDAERGDGAGVTAGSPCPMCGTPTFRRHCKYVCPHHGVVVDCSDPFTF